MDSRGPRVPSAVCNVVRRLAAALGGSHSGLVAQMPNMRLKLSGGDRSKGNGLLCAGAHELSFNGTPRGGRVARSLSAIR